jgi:hypothetical protein
MKRIGTITGVLLVFILICACQKLSIPKLEEIPFLDEIIKPESKYHNERMSALSTDILLAIDTLDAAREGTLDSFPYARIDSNSSVNVEDTKSPGPFSVRKIGIVKYEVSYDDTKHLITVTETRDNLGRLDLRNNRLVYKVRQPNNREAQAIVQHIKKSLKYTAGMRKEVKESNQKAIKEFQKRHGLTPDGIIGTKSANMYSRKAKVLDVKELCSSIIYPTEPRSTLFILSYETVARAPDQFNRGYASLDAVKQHALSADEFKKLALPGSRFVLFLYFLDRLSPDKAVRMCLSKSENRKTKSLSPMKYALPGVWPVITEILSIDDAMGETSLYVNVYIKKLIMDDCIASHRIM